MQAQLPSVEELRERMKNVRPFPLVRNTFYRDSPVAAYAIFGTGALYGIDSGARYSPPQKFPVLYLAADRLQAQLEVAHHANRHLPRDSSDQIRDLHKALTSFKVSALLNILDGMANSDELHCTGNCRTMYSEEKL